MNNYLRDQNLGIRSVKITQFEALIHESHRQYTPDTRNIRTRQLTKTPISTNRHINPESPRSIHSTHEKRLSAFLEKQINQLEHHRHQDHMSPVARDKINELR
jgi:hypothetical protein